MQKEAIIGLKELRENTQQFISQIKNGQSFLVVRRSKPIFKISQVNDEESRWEEVVDFTKIRKNGVKIDEILSRL